MTKLNEIFRRTEETEQTERAAHRRGWTIAKYLFLTACGFALYRNASVLAIAERGYKATGGETLFLLFPLFYYLFSTLIRDMHRCFKTTFKEDNANDERE